MKLLALFRPFCWSVSRANLVFPPFHFHVLFSIFGIDRRIVEQEIILWSSIVGLKLATRLPLKLRAPVVMT